MIDRRKFLQLAAAAGLFPVSSMPFPAMIYKS
jgi:hypothetical protein